MEFLHNLEFVYKYIFRDSQYQNLRNKPETLVTTIKGYSYDFLDLYISAMHRIFIRGGAIISDTHALNRPFKPIVSQDY